MQQYVDQLSAAQREIERLRANRSPPKDKITRESSRNTQDANNQPDSSAFPSNLSALPCTPAKKPAYVHTYVPRQNKGANGSNEEETKPIGVSDFDTEKTPKRACGVSMSTSSRDVATSTHAHNVRGRPVRFLDLCQSYDMDSDMDIQETEYTQFLNFTRNFTRNEEIKSESTIRSTTFRVKLRNWVLSLSLSLSLDASMSLSLIASPGLSLSLLGVSPSPSLSLIQQVAIVRTEVTVTVILQEPRIGRVLLLRRSSLEDVAKINTP
jgi:hypothetical protein